MGVGIWPSSKNSSSSYDSPPPASVNPNPNKFELLEYEERYGMLILKVKYEGCTNYEGTKILVFDKGVTLGQLWRQKSLDPHFSDNKKMISPVARFIPTERGWHMAIKFVKGMSGND